MEKELKLLQAKLRRPVHISFISEYILDKDMDTTRKIMAYINKENGISQKKG